MKPAIFSSTVQALAKQNDWPLSKAVDYIADLGIGAVQHSSGMVRSDFYPEFEKELKRRNIITCCIHHTTHLGNADEAIFAASVLDTMRVVDDAARIGSHFVMILPETREDVTDDPADRMRCLERSAEGLRYAAAYAHTKNVTIVIENISRYYLPFSTADDLEYLAKNVPYLKLNYDTGNFFCCDQDGIAAYEQLKGNFELVHTKDWKYIDEGGFPKEDGTHLGDEFHGSGLVPICEMMKLLERDSYGGWCVIEHGGTELAAKIKNAAELIKKHAK